MIHRYGEDPKVLGSYDIKSDEMFFYQDMLVKDKRYSDMRLEPRLHIFNELIDDAINDFIEEFGIGAFINHYVYISAKHLLQQKDAPFNRPGWHCDGFMSDDINYIWSDVYPTVFNHSEFNLTQDHSISIAEMGEQALEENNYSHAPKTLVRLNQYNVHRVADVKEAGMRLFIKVTFSRDKFNLRGNTHNYLIDYKWDLRDRALDRNTPQS